MEFQVMFTILFVAAGILLLEIAVNSGRRRQMDEGQITLQEGT